MVKKLLVTKKRPSPNMSALKGIIGRKSKHKIGETIPPIEIKWPNVKLNPKYIDAYSAICGLERTSTISMLYPFTLIYPLNLELISQKQVPVQIFKMLATRFEATMHREILDDEVLDVVSGITGQQFRPKGMEFYLESTVTAGTELVWENRFTMYVPARHGQETGGYTAAKFEEVPEAEVLDKWYLGATDRIKFARVLGDSNGIHYNAGYAKMFGFERDTSQPIRVAAKCVDFFTDIAGNPPCTVDMLIKGPVYYERELTLKGGMVNGSQRFDLFCEGNDRPSISGSISGSK